jgi:hypothetical protein
MSKQNSHTCAEEEMASSLYSLYLMTEYLGWSRASDSIFAAYSEVLRIKEAKSVNLENKELQTCKIMDFAAHRAND